jgi:hypothetical protein
MFILLMFAVFTFGLLVSVYSQDLWSLIRLLAFTVGLALIWWGFPELFPSVDPLAMNTLIGLHLFMITSSILAVNMSESA